MSSFLCSVLRATRLGSSASPNAERRMRRAGATDAGGGPAGCVARRQPGGGDAGGPHAGCGEVAAARSAGAGRPDLCGGPPPTRGLRARARRNVERRMLNVERKTRTWGLLPIVSHRSAGWKPVPPVGAEGKRHPSRMSNAERRMSNAGGGGRTRVRIARGAHRLWSAGASQIVRRGRRPPSFRPRRPARRSLGGGGKPRGGISLPIGPRQPTDPSKTEESPLGSVLLGLPDSSQRGVGDVCSVHCCRGPSRRTAAWLSTSRPRMPCSWSMRGAKLAVPSKPISS